MKALLVLLVLLTFVGRQSFAEAPRSVHGRTLGEIDLISKRVLKRSISPKFYQSLLISPIEGLIEVRAMVSGGKLFQEKIVRSDLDGRFDQIALQTAKEMMILGDYKLDSQIKTSAVRVHVLIYQIADGTMVLSFATLDRPGGEQADYFGSARLRVLKTDGSWVEITGPSNLRNLAIRDSGLKNNFELQMKLERISGR